MTSINVRDGLINFISGLGTRHDKSVHGHFVARTIGYRELDALYTDNWIASNIVDVPIEDAFRKGRCVQAGDFDLAKFRGELQRLDADAKFREVGKFARLYGGAVILMVTDAPDFASPLSPSEVVSSLVVLDRHEIAVRNVNTMDLRSAEYMSPTAYSIGSEIVDSSRVLRFDGFATPRRVRRANSYWGGSVIQRVYEAIRNAQNVGQNVETLINQVSTDIFKTPNLDGQLTSGGVSGPAMDRFNAASYMRSNLNMMLLDTKEEYERVAVNLSGLSDMITRYLQIVCAAARMPQTKLLGASAQGLNATGEGDTRDYYDMVSAMRSTMYDANFGRLDRQVLGVLYGGVPDGYTSTWEPLMEMSESERATVQLQRAQRDQIYLQAGVVTEAIVAQDLLEYEDYSRITSEYVDALEDYSDSGKKP